MRQMTRKPTHPGIIIKKDYLEPLKITIKNMANTLGISITTLSKIINERGSISPDIALRLSNAFDTTPDFWLNLQKNYDLWKKGVSLHKINNEEQLEIETMFGDIPYPDKYVYYREIEV
jgi:antitoxin HigA-1